MKPKSHLGICGGGGSHRVGVEQLTGNQCQAQNDAQHLGGAHLFGHRPADAHRQHVEHRFTNKPEEAVHAGPELADVTQGLGAVLEQVEAVDTVAETQDQTAGDDGGDQRGEDLGQGGHDALQRVLVLLGGALYRVFGNALDARHRNEIVVEIRHRVADDDLELAGLGKGALGHLHALDLGHVRFGRVVEHEPHAGDAVGNRGDILFTAYVFQQFLGVLLVFAHKYFLLQPLDLFEQVPFAILSIRHLFKQVNGFSQKRAAESRFSAQSTKKSLAPWAISRYTGENV